MMVAVAVVVGIVVGLVLIGVGFVIALILFADWEGWEK